jgi:hypothetical protein
MEADVYRRTVERLTTIERIAQGLADAGREVIENTDGPPWQDWEQALIDKIAAFDAYQQQGVD